MRYLIFSFTFLITTDFLFGQDDIYGVYGNNYDYRKIIILPGSDSIMWQKSRFSYHKSPFKVIQDTLFIFFREDSTKSDTIERYLISRYGLVENPNEQGISLYRIYKTDTIISEQVIGKLNDYEGLYFPTKNREIAYHHNKNIHYDIKYLGRIKICTFYHFNGQLKQVQFYKKSKHIKPYKRRFKPHGTWYYHNEQGQVIKIEIYKRGKLKETIYN